MATQGGERRRPGRQRSAQAQQATLDAAGALLWEGGYAAMTMEAVAARAGVSKATVYRWWPTRIALALDALHHAAPVPTIHVTGDTWADIRALTEFDVELFVRSPLGSSIAAMAADLVAYPEGRGRFAELLGSRRAAASSVVLAAAARGDLPHDVDADLLLDVIAGVVLFRGLTEAELTDRHLDQLTDLVVRGLMPRRSGAGWQPPRSP
ncbi:TetR/AcrR family transcriptional regulator [Pseudonocardia endophytica]|uniref:TetR family transcriptional regulator n=1 Tax=Pseudonocardia endophytica TaxID=401976 RepID=A0A4R1HIV8_PSEEN|nr:TetR/AcrR family transcriptional regulator [Pseudonocardia endophytica]TCK20901.1 TetR family transcriptional regulator [Pseudonocardia endophytica]